MRSTESSGKYDLIAKLTEEENAAVAAAEDKLDRGEKLAGLELAGPIEDFLPESETSILTRLTALPRTTGTRSSG